MNVPGFFFAHLHCIKYRPSQTYFLKEEIVRCPDVVPLVRDICGVTPTGNMISLSQVSAVPYLW